VFLNGVLLSVIPLNEVGENERQIAIPIDTFVSVGTDRLEVLRFILDSGELCYANAQFDMFIHTNSYFTLPHEITRPDTSLVNFPRPIYQNTFVKDFALLVVPEQPSPAEMQAAMTIAASLGNFSQNTIALDMTTLSKLTPDQTTTNHLIFVGKASSLPVLGDLELPQPVREGQFQSTGSSPDDGVIQMINSPWDQGHVILVVSGNTDLGIIKAAQAISSGILRPNRFPNLAIVQEVEPTPISIPQPVDQTLADLGYTGSVFTNRGVNAAYNYFSIPLGFTVTSDAYFELVYSHSALLNYDRSTIVVLLNDRPIGSVRLDDTSASRSINRVKIDIPPSAVISGNNSLVLRADLVPIDNCTPPGVQGLWLRIWPESTLHLPLEEMLVIDPVSDVNLAAFPAPFANDTTLGNTAFLLPRNNLDAWREAARIAGFLGYRASGPLTTLSVFYGDGFPETERSRFNLLAVGRPSELPVIGEINDALPGPFSKGSDIAIETNFQVTYQIPSDLPIGYVEVIPSPWNSEKVVFAALGNSAQGVKWAASSLIDPDISWQLAGNFAAVTDQQIVTTDTRLTSSSSTGLSTESPVENIPLVSPNQEQPPVAARPDWILPALILTIALIVLILAIVVFRKWLGNRNGSKLD
jgi:hypothetical protein